MHCPFCRHTDSRVMDSRTTDDGSSIRRRRQCPECGRRFTTIETASLTVTKRSGVSEPFSRSQGPRRRPQGLPGPPGHRGRPGASWPSGSRSASASRDRPRSRPTRSGLAILGPLRELDEVAYLRFASVYQAFDSLEDFEAAITLLRAEREATGDGARPAAPDHQTHGRYAAGLSPAAYLADAGHRDRGTVSAARDQCQQSTTPGAREATDD